MSNLWKKLSCLNFETIRTVSRDHFTESRMPLQFSHSAAMLKLSRIFPSPAFRELELTSEQFEEGPNCAATAKRCKLPYRSLPW